jgi:hypothetical protein
MENVNLKMRNYRKFILSLRERMSEGQVREKGVIKKRKTV